MVQTEQREMTVEGMVEEADGREKVEGGPQKIGRGRRELSGQNWTVSSKGGGPEGPPY